MEREEPQLLNVQRAADFLGVHPNTIRRWAQEEKLVGQRLGTRGDWRFTKGALQQLMSNGHLSSETSEIPVVTPLVGAMRTDPPVIAMQADSPMGIIRTSTDGKHSSHDSSLVDFLTGGGEMGERIRSKDWSQTSLGPAEYWPQSLKTVVRIMLTSRQPIWIGWGAELIKLYNDPYKAIVGGKHPEALGQPASVVWHEIWDDLSPRLQTALQKNEGTYDESLLLIMERYGYPEETYYTFSYSPVPSDYGGVGGIICANTDDTQRIIGERQVKLLRTLAAETVDARTIEAACRLSAKSLEQNAHDILFAALYLLDSEQQQMYLVGTSNIQPGHQAVPTTVALDDNVVWPFQEVLRTGKTSLVSHIDSRFENLPAGVWKRPSHQAAVVPLAPSGQTGKAGVLVVGLNPLRLFDEGYQGFISLVAGQIAANLGNAQTYEEERRRAEVLAELDRAKTVFFSNVSHEFRTPLTLMLGPIEDMLAERQTLSDEQYAHIDLLHRNALRLLKLVNTLLDFSRIEAGRMQAVYEPTNLAVLTTDLASNFRSAIEKAGMQLIVDCSPLSEPIYVDHEMWEKIVLNLLTNAFKYTLKGTITVTLRQRGAMVEMSVSDTGVGIPAEELPHMFERFHRVKMTRGRTFEGSGIGLSLVQELVKIQGGTISIKSALGEGSTFTVSLPLGTAHLPQEHLAVQNTSPTMTAITSGAQRYVGEAFRLLPDYEAAFDLSSSSDATFPSAIKSSSYNGSGEQLATARILLADDNTDMREYVRRLLQQRYVVQAVANGKAALAAIEQQQPDLVLADVMMPEIDGFELLHTLRSNPQTNTLPVMLLSARAGEEAKIEGMQAGADDYLVKPFNARELLARVGAHLEIARIRKEAEREVRENEERFRTLANDISQLVWMADETGWIFWYNKRWYDYTGTTLQEMEGWGWQKVHHPEHVKRVIEKISHCFQTGKVWEDTFPLRGKDGTYRWFLSRAVPIKNEEGNVIRWLGTNTDITEQRQLEQKKDEFIGIASHELKTPVTSLKAYTKLLEMRSQKAGDERATELIRKMDGQLNKLNGLIGDLLDVTKIEGGKLQFHPATFDYNELVAEIVEDIQRTTSKHTIMQEASSPVTLFADRDRIGQVLINLLTNAIKYSPQAETILVKITQTDNTVKTSVQDFGIGIPKEKQPYIFERFFRVEGETQTTFPGLGLGLYIAAEIVRRHHGTIWVESEEGKGTTVAFSLPLSSDINKQNMA